MAARGLRRSQSGPALRAAATALLGDPLARTSEPPTHQPLEQQWTQKPSSAPEHGVAQDEFSDEMQGDDDDQVEQIDEEEMERIADVEAKLEAELEAAFAELASNLRHNDYEKLDSGVHSRVAQLAPRLRTHQIEKQQKTQAQPGVAKSRGSRPPLPSSQRNPAMRCC